MMHFPRSAAHWLLHLVQKRGKKGKMIFASQPRASNINNKSNKSNNNNSDNNSDNYADDKLCSGKEIWLN